MSRILITGASGFTSPYLAASLARAGHDLYGIVHVGHNDCLKGFRQSFEADLVDLPRITEILNQVQPHHVVHLAGVAFVGRCDIGELYQSNVVATRQLLEALALLQR